MCAGSRVNLTPLFVRNTVAVTRYRFDFCFLLGWPSSWVRLGNFMPNLLSALAAVDWPATLSELEEDRR